MRIFSDFIASDSLALVNFDELPGLFLLKNPPISWPYGTGVAEFSARSRRTPLGVLLDYTRIASIFGPLSVQPTHQHVLRLLVLVEYLKLCALPRSTLTPDQLALVLVDEKDALTTALRASSPSGTVVTEPDYLVFTPKVYDLVLARHHAQTLTALLPAIIASLNLAAGYRGIGPLYEMLMDAPADDRQEAMQQMVLGAWKRSVTATLYRLAVVSNKHVKTTNKWRKAFDAIHRDVSIDDTALTAAVRAPRPRVDLLTGELNP